MLLKTRTPDRMRGTALLRPQTHVLKMKHRLRRGQEAGHKLQKDKIRQLTEIVLQLNYLETQQEHVRMHFFKDDTDE